MLAVHTRSHQRDLLPSASEKVTVDGTVRTLTAALANACVEAIIRFEGGDIRTWWDGSVPTATDGILRLDGDVIRLTRSEAKLLQMIRIGAIDGIAWVVYYR